MLLITGASGFLGSAVARMAHSREIPFRAMVRESSRLDLLSNIPMENIVQADMSDAESLKAAVEGVDAVIHCAATTSQAAPDLDLSPQGQSQRLWTDQTRSGPACACRGKNRMDDPEAQYYLWCGIEGNL